MGIHSLHPAVHEYVVVNRQATLEKAKDHMVRGVDERTVVNREIHVRVVQVKDAGLFREGLQVGEIRTAHSLGSDRIHLGGLDTGRLTLLLLVVAGH